MFDFGFAYIVHGRKTTQNATDYRIKCVTFFTHFEIRFTHFYMEMRVRCLFYCFFFFFSLQFTARDCEAMTRTMLYGFFVCVFWSFWTTTSCWVKTNERKYRLEWVNNLFFDSYNFQHINFRQEKKNEQMKWLIVSIFKYYYFKLKRLSFFSHLSLFVGQSQKKKVRHLNLCHKFLLKRHHFIP